MFTETPTGCDVFFLKGKCPLLYEEKVYRSRLLKHLHVAKNNMTSLGIGNIRVTQNSYPQCFIVCVVIISVDRMQLRVDKNTTSHCSCPPKLMGFLVTLDGWEWI